MPPIGTLICLCLHLRWPPVVAVNDLHLPLPIHIVHPIHTVASPRVDAIWLCPPVHRLAVLMNDPLVQLAPHPPTPRQSLDVRIHENASRIETISQTRSDEIDHRRRAINCVANRSTRFTGNDRNRVILDIMPMVRDSRMHSMETDSKLSEPCFRNSQVCPSSLPVWTFVSIESAARTVVISTSLKATASSCRSLRKTWVLAEFLANFYWSFVPFSGCPRAHPRSLQLAASTSTSSPSSFKHVFISRSITCKRDEQFTYTDASIESTATTASTTLLVAWRCLESNASLQSCRSTGQHSFFVATTAAYLARTILVSSSHPCLSYSTNLTGRTRHSFGWASTHLRIPLSCNTSPPAPAPLLDEFPFSPFGWP